MGISIANECELIDAFQSLVGDVPDPRFKKRVLYPLPEVLFVLFVGTLCNNNDIDEIVIFAREELSWFRRFMSFTYGIPTAQTFRRILSMVDSVAFAALFTAWAEQWRDRDVIAIDGKCLRGASEKKEEHKGLYMISALGTSNGMVLGQQKVQEKSNEITAIPALLKNMDINHSIITLDAMGTQSKIAKLIIEMGADYVLALKGNQGGLHDDVKIFFDDKVLSLICEEYTKTDHGHGRIEERTIRVMEDITWLKERHPQWDGLRSIVSITSVRTSKKTGITTTETRYYISSLPANAKHLLEVIRSHWSIENGLHWVLDVVFREDQSRLRKNHAPANMAIIRKVVLNALKRDTTQKMSLKLKRTKAAHNLDFRTSLIFS